MSRPFPLQCAFALVLVAIVPSTLAAQEASDPVEAFQNAFVDAVRRYDVDAWAALLLEDAVMMTPLGQTIEGREAFRAYWAEAWQGRRGTSRNPLSLNREDVMLEGDLAVVRLAYGPGGSDPVGDYTWVLRRTDEGYRLAWWIFTRRPPSPPSTGRPS